MARYYLVASNYDRTKKTYSNEIIIKSINGINLTSLDKIDKFTSEYTSLEIFNMIEEELNKKDLNCLSIKYLKNKEAQPKYYKTITSNKELNECIKTIRKHKITILDKTRDTMLVSRNNSLFKQELSKLLEIIKQKDINKFYDNYPYDPKISDLSFLVERYLNTAYDNELDKEKDLELILLEFSRYKTFRGWIVEQIKKKYNQTKHTSNKKTLPITKGYLQEAEEEFLESFEKKHKISYDEYNTNKYNQEYEEYLSEEEFEFMNEEQPKSLGRRH